MNAPADCPAERPGRKTSPTACPLAELRMNNMGDKLQALANSTQAKFEDVTKTLDEVKAKGESTNEMVQDISRKLAFLDGADAMKERLKDRQYEQRQLSLGKIAVVASLASGAFGGALAIVWEVGKLLISSLSKGVPPHG